MTGPPVVEFRGLRKVYDDVAVVDDVSFQVQPGRVVGLLGRNGAGKTTLLRCLLGLTRPTAGTATVLGATYDALTDAAHRVGVMLDSVGHVPGATGFSELRIWARTLGLPNRRVDEVLDQVDLVKSAGKKVKGYSTGMKQRLAIAVSLLADPEVLLLDEPANGLDPDGVRWLRRTIRGLADEGRTVLLSSHLLAEVEQTVDDVVILAGSLLFAGPLAELTVDGGRSLEDSFFAVVDGHSAGQKQGGLSHA